MAGPVVSRLDWADNHPGLCKTGTSTSAPTAGGHALSVPNSMHVGSVTPPAPHTPCGPVIFTSKGHTN